MKAPEQVGWHSLPSIAELTLSGNKWVAQWRLASQMVEMYLNGNHLPLIVYTEIELQCAEATEAQLKTASSSNPKALQAPVKALHRPGRFLASCSLRHCLIISPVLLFAYITSSWLLMVIATLVLSSVVSTKN